MKTPFCCPCCRTTGLAELGTTAPDTGLLAVCVGCAAYCIRYGDEWQALGSRDIQLLKDHKPDVFAGLEAGRIALANAWAKREPFPPTIFAEVMVEMVRTRGMDSILWKGGEWREAPSPCR